MRTTLTLDDRLADSLQEMAHRNRLPFKVVVNKALSLGLRAMDEPSPQTPYRLSPVSMGGLREGLDLNKALALADSLEDEAIFTKLEMRK